VPGPKPPSDTRPGPYTGDAVAQVQGRELFVRYNCSGCHGGRGGGGMGPSLRDEDWIYGSSDADIFDSISQGRAHGMPAWGTRVPEQQLWKLVAYIDSMRKPNEPDAPRE
jgi:cytochrome c oxidase cbb3-type subunit 3